MIKIIKTILNWISRVIFWIIPYELREGLAKRKLQIKLENNLVEETFKNFKEHFKKSLLFYSSAWEIREYAIKNSLLNDKNKEYYYLEFGVHKGGSANFFSKYVKKLYAFDSFEGLKEDWEGTSNSKGTFNLNKQIPKLNSNVEPIVGCVEDTLDDFLKKYDPKINFVHLDMDTYSPTKFALEKIKPYLVKDAIIIFDQLYNYIGWENGEYKSLIEVFNKEEFKYKAFAISDKRSVPAEGSQSVIQIK